MKINAYAKINIGLDVLGKRPDGYHEVRMIMQTIDLHDELDITPSDEPGIRITTNIRNLPVGDDNLISRAAKLMFDEFSLPGGLKVDLSKNIPVAAGLAGGSSDAAATLKAVNGIYALGLGTKELAELGVRIGADVPYCIRGGTAVSEGIGEKLTPIKPFPACPVLIAKPPVSVSTAYVYKNLRLEDIRHPDIDGIISGIERGDLRAVAGNMGNVLESVTIGDNPVIDTIKGIMTEEGCLASLMSGSGPSVFGLFDSEEKMKSAYERLEAAGLVSDLFISQIYDPEGSVDGTVKFSMKTFST